jgi:hypothetical protein
MGFRVLPSYDGNLECDELKAQGGGKNPVRVERRVTSLS